MRVDYRMLLRKYAVIENKVGRSSTSTHGSFILHFCANITRVTQTLNDQQHSKEIELWFHLVRVWPLEWDLVDIHTQYTANPKESLDPFFSASSSWCLRREYDGRGDCDGVSIGRHLIHLQPYANARPTQCGFTGAMVEKSILIVFLFAVKVWIFHPPQRAWNASV